MNRWIQIALLTALPVLINAQALSYKGRFSVEFDRGCSPMTVNINVLDTFGDVDRVYFYFEGADVSGSETFTYDQPGAYQIIQIVDVNGIDNNDTLDIEVLDEVRPQISITKCNGLEVFIESTDTYYDSVRVYFGPADSATLQFNESTTYTFASDNIQTFSTKGLFNNADEICDTFLEETLPLPFIETPLIDTAYIKETCRGSYSAYIEVDRFYPLVNYQVYLSQNQSSLIYDGQLTGTSIILHDIPFDRQSNYCLTVATFDPCNGSITSSQEACGESSELSLSPFESLYSSYEGDSIFIKLDQVAVGSFEIYRGFRGSEFNLRSTTSASFFDAIGAITRQYSYRIDYRDRCGSILYTANTNPPFIDASFISENLYQITFGNAQNSLGNPSESRFQVGNDPALSTGMIESLSFELKLNSKDGSPRQFLSAASSYSNGVTIGSNAQVLKYEQVIYVPSAFTPNDDGLNDILIFYGLPTNNATVKIYNRWGQLIFTTDDASQGWNGTIRNQKAPEGTYMYEITFESTPGNKQSQRGTFALINR